MSINEKMTALADSIREKSGISGKLSIDEMKIAVDSITTGGGYSIAEALNELYAGRTDFKYAMAYNIFIEAPFFDTSNGTIFSYMFYNCLNLQTVPQLDTSNGTSFNNMFYGCEKLQTVPQLDTNNGTSFSYMFHDCSNLQTVPQLDTSNGTNFSNMFYGCMNLQTVPQFDTSKGRSFNYMFYSCMGLQTVPQLDISNGTNFSNMFYACFSLKNITFVGIIPNTIDFSYASKLTAESLISIINALKDLTGLSSKKLYIGSTNIAKLTEEQLAIIENKNWTYQ